MIRFVKTQNAFQILPIFFLITDFRIQPDVQDMHHGIELEAFEQVIGANRCDPTVLKIDRLNRSENHM